MLKIEIDGNDSLSHEHKEEIHIFHKSMDLLICSILNNSNYRKVVVGLTLKIRSPCLRR